MSKKSISQLLHRASRARAVEIAQEWAQHWQNDQEAILRRMTTAAATGNMARIELELVQLRAVTEKRFTALPRVIELIGGNHDDHA